MKTIQIALVLVMFGLVAQIQGAEIADLQKALKQIQGEWTMVSGSADGRSMPENMLKQMKRSLTGDELVVTMAGQPFFKAKVTIDSTTNPKTIDYEMTEGLTRGKRQLGIYEIEGDTFKSSFGSPDAPRPTDFTSKLGDGRTVTVWKRLEK